MTSRNTPVQTQQHYTSPKLTYKYSSTSRGWTPKQTKATFFRRRLMPSLNAYLRCSAGSTRLILCSQTVHSSAPSHGTEQPDEHRHVTTWYGKPSLATSYLSPREAVGYKPHCSACKPKWQGAWETHVQMKGGKECSIVSWRDGLVACPFSRITSFLGRGLDGLYQYFLIIISLTSLNKLGRLLFYYILLYWIFVTVYET